MTGEGRCLKQQNEVFRIICRFESMKQEICRLNCSLLWLFTENCRYEYSFYFCLPNILLMSFEKIISIPGLSGLFKMVAQMRNGGFVVEALADGRRMPVSSMQRIIMLKDIAVYTVEDDMPLYTVFKKMKEQDAVASAVSSKAEPADLKATLKKILPEFDEERVHASDIRKMFIWYKLVKDIVGSPEAEKAMQAELEGAVEPAVEVAPAVEETVAAEEPVKKKTTRKKKEEPVADGGSEEAPKKKSAKKAAKSE